MNKDATSARSINSSPDMPVTVEITLPPHKMTAPDIRAALVRSLGRDVSHWRLRKRSLDARKRPVYRLRIEVFDQAPPAEPDVTATFRDVHNAPAVHIIGAGPAGYFAALKALELGLRPIVLERGLPVRERRRSLRQIQQFGIVDPDSNYCFGEGGAGTYSDGKLYTRAHKRGNIEHILRLLVAHGAPPDILVDAHPHIGSNKLPRVVRAIRKTIEQYGGQVRFQSKLTDLILRDNRVETLIINGQEEIPTRAVVLATGHSARDVYAMLQRHGVYQEFKPFALGVRVEHPQPLIDEMQYRQPRGQYLPAASYRLTCQVDGRGVFSFCMCPGGLIVPAATAPGEIVVNGMSLSRRDSPFANSGFVTEVRAADLPVDPEQDALAGVLFQQQVERAAFAAGDGSQKAPAQRLTDFVEGRLSPDLPPASYIPGLLSRRVDELLPDFITRHIRQALLDLRKRLPAFYTREANVVAVESRTSAPVRILRHRDSYRHIQMDNLYPCGEGAGYAGGIVSAALDGQNVMTAVAQRLLASGKR